MGEPAVRPRDRVRNNLVGIKYYFIHSVNIQKSKAIAAHICFPEVRTQRLEDKKQEKYIKEMELEVAAALLDASRRLSSGDVATDTSAQGVGNHFISRGFHDAKL